MIFWDSEVPSLQCQCIRYFAIKHHRYFSIKEVLPKVLVRKIQELEVEIGVYIKIHKRFFEIRPEEIIISNDLSVDWKRTAKHCYRLMDDKNAFVFAVLNALVEEIPLAWNRFKNAIGSVRSFCDCGIIRSTTVLMELGLPVRFSCLSAAQEGFPLVYQYAFAEALEVRGITESGNSTCYVMYYFYKIILHRNYHMINFITMNVDNFCYHRMHKYFMHNCEKFITNLVRVPRRFHQKTLFLVKKFFEWSLDKQIMQYRILLDELRFQKSCEYVNSLYHLLPRAYGCHIY